MVAGAGTGGTVTGISRAIKKTHNSKCIVVGVDPVGYLSILILTEVDIPPILLERQYPRFP